MMYELIKKASLTICGLMFLFILSLAHNVYAMVEDPLYVRLGRDIDRERREHAARVAARARAAEEDEEREIRLARQGRGAGDPEVDALRRRNERRERDREIEQEAEKVLIGFWGGVSNAITGRMNAKNEEARIKAQGAEDRATAVAEAQAKIAAYGEQLKDPKTLLYLAGGTLAVFGVYYALKLGYQHIEANMGKPTLVRDSSRQGLVELLKNFFMGKDEIEYKLSDIVLSPDVQEKATILAQDTKETREYRLPYQNVLFYGPPGTGKTEFAKIISHYSGMDYAIMSGADFSQFKGGEAIAELHKLFDWAKASPNGLIIFIDEADACFRDRSTLDKDGVSFVNAFLSQTGSGSDKFMIVLATNYEDELDAAVRSRLHKKVPFFLPSLEDRFLITKKKMDKYLFNDKRMFEKDGQEISVHLSVASDINDDYIMSLAQKLDGFSGRDIDQMVSEVRLRAYRSGQNLVTKEIIDDVAANKKAEIEKDKLTTLYQRERQNAARAKLHVMKDNQELSAAAAA